MKKLLLITGCAVFFATTSFAQDTLKVRQNPQDKTQERSQSDDLRKRNAEEELSGWTRVAPQDIPENLRTTLDESQYKGWENGNVYRNQTDDMFQLRMSGNDPKVYYFDKEGKATKKPDYKR